MGNILLNYINVENMADFMLNADLAISAGGISESWERACLGLPTLLVTLADNQKLIATNLDKRLQFKISVFIKL